MIEIGIDIKTLLKEEIDRIAISLINSSIEDSDGMKWPIYMKDTQGKLEKTYSYNIYSGNAGIILFFIEAYKLSKKKEYLNVIENSINGMLALCAKDKSINYSFYNGKGGVLYTLLQFYLLKGKDINVLNQIEVLLNSELSSFIHSHYVDDSLFEGRSGLLIVLNYLHSELKNEFISDLIFETVEAIIINIKLNADEIYWMHDKNNAFPPISYANGTSGIVYALMEMRNQIGDEYLSFLLKHVKSYENLFWDEKTRNWLIYRKVISNYADYLFFKGKYKSGEFNFFNATFDNISLINGAVGIGLSRLRAFDVLKEVNILEEILKLDIKLQIESNNLEDCSIATGKSGILLYYLESLHVLGDNKYQAAVIKELENIVNIKNKVGTYQFENKGIYSKGLMDGLVGIGYIFLSILNPSIDSIVLPKPSLKIEPRNDEIEHLETVNLKEYILGHRFRYLFSLVKKILPNELEMYIESEDFCENGFLDYILEKSNNIKFEQNLIDNVLIEKKEIELKQMIGNGILNFIENQINSEWIEKKLNEGEELFLRLKLKLSDKVRIVNVRLNSSSNEEVIMSDAQQLAALLLLSSNIIYKWVITDPRELLILEMFFEAQTIESVIDKCCGLTDSQKIDVKIKEKSIFIIREFIFSGILVDANNTNKLNQNNLNKSVYQ